MNAHAGFGPLRWCVLVVLISCGGGYGQPTPPAATEPAPNDPIRLELVWSVGSDRYGIFEGVDVDRATGEVYAAFGAYDGFISVARLDRQGNELARKRMGPGAEGGMLRLAQLDGEGDLELITSRRWGRVVQAFDMEGTPRWSHSQPDGVDDIWAQDLDGDGRDEVIIGYNGHGGIQVRNPDGTLRWKSTIIGNVWSVTAGPIGPEGAMRVLAPGRGFGKVQVFDADGNALEPLDLPLAGGENGKGGAGGRERGPDVYWVRIGQLGADPVVLVSDNRTSIAGLDRDGKVIWRSGFVSGGSARDFMASPDRPWIAFAVDYRRVVVHDVRTGERLLNTDVEWAKKLAWVAATGDEPPLLIVDARNAVKAFAIRGSTPAPASPPPDYAALGLPAPDPARGQPVAWFRDSYIYPDDLAGRDLQALIARPLLEDFAREQKLEPTKEQIRSFNRWLTRESGQPPPKGEEAAAMLDQVARASVQQWLISKALYERYGGTVIFQQANPMEPVGALRGFLEEHESKGSFKILDPEHREAFWSYYTRDHTSFQVPKNQIDFSRPWWELKPRR